MNKAIFYTTIIFLTMAFSFSGCNIVPKSVQYQKEEEGLLGSTDIVNPVVEEIQVVLAGLGYEVPSKDGRMGQKTRSAIKEFQGSIGVRATGYIDKATLMQIDDIRRANDEGKLKGNYKIRVRKAYSGEGNILKPETMVTTRRIQTALKNAGFDPGTIDGKMGPRTEQAIKEFQRTKGLKIDGKVGPQTWAKLSKYLI